MTSVPAASLGTVYLADNVTAVTANTAYTLAQIQGMKFLALPSANGSGTFSYRVQDSGGTANGGVDSLTESLTISVTSVNDAPVNTVPGAQTVNEDTAFAFTAGTAITVNDVDGNLATTRLTVASGKLNVNLGGGATISAGANSSATLTLSGTQTQINAALATLTYQGNANFNGSDSLQVLSTDSAGTPLSDTDTVAITVTSVNDAPVNSLPIGQAINTSGTLTFSAGNGNLLSVSDVDTANLTVTLAVGAGTLSLSTTSGLAFIAGDGTTDATMTFSGSQASINAALAGLRYFAPASAQAATLTVTTSDGLASPVVNTVPIAVTVVGTPVIDLNTGTAGTGFSATYVENAASPVNITGTSSVTDSNSANMSQATITIGNFVAGDTLTWTNQAGIATSYNSATGVLTATGAATKATYQTLLQSVKFSTASDNPTLYGASPTRSISVVVKDDTAVSSNTAISTITVTPVNDAPVQATGSTLNYTENGASAAINSSITVTDVDNTTLSTATVSITTNFVSGQDVLSFTNVPATMGNITGTYNAAAGVMNLGSAGNSATLAQWQAALQAVQYSNSSDNPSTAARTVSFRVNDSAANSNTVTSTVNVASVNDAPVATITSSTYAATEQLALALHGTGLSIADLDAGAASNIVATLSVGEGTLTVTAGSSGVTVGGSGTGSVTLTGTVAQINALLASAGGATGTVSYTDNLDAPSASTTLTLSVNDAGNTGSGGALIGSDTATINIAAVNDAPVFTGTVAGFTYTENATVALVASPSVSDVDASNFNGGTVTVLFSAYQTGDLLSINNQGRACGANRRGGWKRHLWWHADWYLHRRKCGQSGCHAEFKRHAGGGAGVDGATTLHERGRSDGWRYGTDARGDSHAY